MSGHGPGDSSLRAQVDALLRSQTEDLSGQMTAGYRILSRIGSGGMGDVYLAHDDKLDRPVALKLLSSHAHADPSHLQRFHHEARAASSLNHPHVLVIHDYGDVEGRPFMVTEYVEGRTLRERLRAGPIGVVEAVDIATQVASALSAAHGRGIVHRDIKPENVMIRPDGYVKVLDFGLAKPVSVAAADTALTQPGIVMGTPQYMSPEQARGRDIDERSDVWSLGVMLHEMIAGTTPFAGLTLADVFAAIVGGDPAPLPAAPAAVASCVGRALAKEPDGRYPSAREMHAALVALKAHDASPAPGPTGPVRAVTTGKRASRAIDSVAVLPLVNASGDAALEYLADGITESVINALSQLPKVKVMARSTVFRYKGRDRDPQDVGRELGVRAVLTGRLRTVGDRILIGAELVDATDGSQIWGGQLQGSAADALALQEDAAGEIAAQMRPRLTAAERKRLVKRHTANPRAFEAHLKGRYQLAKRTLDGFTKAIALFEQAIAEDREFALAYAGLADCWTLLSAAAYGDPSARTVARAREAAEQALRLDPNDAEVQTALAFVRFRIDWDWRAAEAAFVRACELGPAHAPAHHRFALMLSALGRHEEALAKIRRAHELDPLSLIIGTAVGRVLQFQRRYDEAIAQCRRTLELDGAFVQARFDLGMACAQAGRHEEAIAHVESSLRPDDPRSVMRAVLGHLYARAGRTQDADAVLQDLERRYRRGDAASYDLSLPLTGLGRAADALDWLERAREARSGLLVFIGVEPMFDTIRAEPRFDALRQRLDLPAGAI